jgi:hypothetical protein
MWGAERIDHPLDIFLDEGFPFSFMDFEDDGYIIIRQIGYTGIDKRFKRLSIGKSKTLLYISLELLFAFSGIPANRKVLDFYSAAILLYDVQRIGLAIELFTLIIHTPFVLQN